ncbi:PEP-CTERM sorting domain-containing protein [Pontiellaceae bacterium B12219]|nr:PEP-CTERM sorting domain-containing protein [Pontiellaceae bacterium B12219]
MKKIVVTLATLLVASGSMAGVVFTDNFDDGNRDGWYLLNDGGQNSLVAETLGTGETVMTFADGDSAAADYYGGVTTFAAQDLSLNGSEITLTLDYINASGWPNGRAWSVGLFNSNGTGVTGDTTAAVDGWGNAGDDSGIYGVSQNGYDRFTIRENVNQGISAGTGGDLTARTWNDSYADPGTWFTYSLKIENIAGNLEYTVTFSGSGVDGQDPVSQTYLDEDVNNYVFDEIAFSARDDVGSSFDNVVVDYVIPEPATLGLVAVFGGGLLFIRRRFMI